MICVLSFILQIWFMIGVVNPQMPKPPVKFKWVQDDSFYDCVVGISAQGTPIGIGVLITVDYVLTSASPLHHLWEWHHPQYFSIGNQIQLFGINGQWNSDHQSLKLDYVCGNQGDRNGKNWVKIGLDSLHSTFFDFIIISVWYEDIRFKRYSDYLRYPCTSNVDHIRKWYSFSYSVSHTLDDFGWHFAAFAFVDKDHIKESQQLVAASFNSESVKVDCDEWLPRRWGKFICLANVDNYKGIQSGAPLFNREYLMGIGAFELNRGNESILVFSDLKEYFNNFGYRGTYRVRPLNHTDTIHCSGYKL